MSDTSTPPTRPASTRTLTIIAIIAGLVILVLAVTVIVMIATRDARPTSPGLPGAPATGGEPSAGSPEPSVPALATVKLGVPFTAEITYTDGTPPRTWQITVTELTCGISRIPGAADNPAYDGSNAKTVDAVPPAGQTFCRLHATMTNTSRTSGDPHPFGDIVLPAGEFTASALDGQISDNLNPEVRWVAINPGGTVQWSQVWTVPAGSKALAVLYPEPTFFSSPTHRIEVA